VTALERPLMSRVFRGALVRTLPGTPLTRMCALAVLTTLAADRPVQVSAQVGAEWNAQAAATYLDGRMSSWLEWPNAQRDHGTTCISCHTAVPYALARPSLRTVLSEPGPTPPEAVMLQHVTARVRLWRDVEAWYPDQTRGLPKTSESRGTEAIINALVLATRDAEAGAMSEDLRAAFSNLWALQMRSAPLAGGWAWLNFGLEPWEGSASAYFGASLAAMAIGRAPGGYSATPAIQEQLDLLRQFLRDGAETESLFDRVMILWASTELAEVLDDSRSQAVVEAGLAVQRADGGWSVADLAPWQRIDGTSLPDASDGFATALMVLTLQEAGGPAAAPAVERGRTWLVAHQDPQSGAVPAWSINKNRDPITEAGKFMSDAATALASIAFSHGH